MQANAASGPGTPSPAFFMVEFEWRDYASFALAYVLAPLERGEDGFRRTLRMMSVVRSGVRMGVGGHVAGGRHRSMTLAPRRNWINRSS